MGALFGKHDKIVSAYQNGRRAKRASGVASDIYAASDAYHDALSAYCDAVFNKPELRELYSLAESNLDLMSALDEYDDHCTSFRSASDAAYSAYDAALADESGAQDGVSIAAFQRACESAVRATQSALAIIQLASQ